MIIEPLYVVDTNALIWHLSNDRRLSGAARAVFAAAERGETRLVLSAVVIAELFYADRKFNLFSDFASLFRRIQQAPHFRLIAFEASHVLDFAGDDAAPEMHDRIIAGLARRLNAPVLTSDARITSAGVAKIAW